jgi:hypothetical protein
VDAPTIALPPGGGGTTDPAAALDAGYAFQVTGATEHITQSNRIVDSAINGVGPAPDIKLALHNGEGTDRLTNQSEWQRTVTFPVITLNHMDVWERFCCKLKNGDTFYGRAAGEQLLLWVTANPIEGGQWSVTFRFGRRKNLTNEFLIRDPADPDNPAATGAFVVPSIKGWDYLEVKYLEEKVGNVIRPTPSAYYIHELYPDGDYEELNIGV